MLKEKVMSLKKYPIVFRNIRRVHRAWSNIYVQYYGNKYGRPLELLLDEAIFKDRYNQLIKELEDKNSEKTYFIIRRSVKNIGLFTHVSVYLAFIAYSVSKGYVPVIDMESFPNMFIDDSDVGKCNAWELFYKQPVMIGLKDIPPGSKRIYSSDIYLPKRSPFHTSLLHDRSEFKMWSQVYEYFISYNQQTKEYTEDEEQIFPPYKRVMGVLYRGTDYSKGQPKGHPIQPSIEVALSKVKELMIEFNCEYIYLASDERAAQEAFESAYPGKVLTNKRMYYDTAGIDFSRQKLADVSFERENDKYLKGLEYLSSINLLSKCNCLVAGSCAGTYAAVIMNKSKYENTFIFDLGLYESQ